MVVLPSPAGVGVTPVTTTSLPWGAPGRMASNETLATSSPYSERRRGSMPNDLATAPIGSTTASREPLNTL